LNPWPFISLDLTVTTGINRTHRLENHRFKQIEVKAPCNPHSIQAGPKENGITVSGPEWRPGADGKCSGTVGEKDGRGSRLSDQSSDRRFFPRSARLLTRNDYDRVFQEGRQIRVGQIQVAILKTDRETSRGGVVLSRKVGKAHERNRLRRIVREVFRLDILPKAESLDLVVRFSAGAGTMPSCEVRKQFLTAVRKFGALSTPL